MRAAGRAAAAKCLGRAHRERRDVVVVEALEEPPVVPVELGKRGATAAARRTAAALEQLLAVLQRAGLVVDRAPGVFF